MKPLVRVFEVIAVLAAVLFVGALFLNEPDDPDVPSTDVTGSDNDDPVVDEPDGSDPDALAVGQELYGRRCGSCHGADGQGGLGPKLGGGAAVANFPDPDDQAEVIREGRGGMPSFGGSLSDEEIDALVEYSRQLPG